MATTQPTRCNPPGHEQERLLRKATAAMLAVPILAFVSVAALLRRSAIARGTLAIGMALSLGVGLVAVGHGGHAPDRDRAAE